MYRKSRVTRSARLPLPPGGGRWYGLGVGATTIQYMLQRSGVVRCRIFDPNGRRLSGSRQAR